MDEDGPRAAEEDPEPGRAKTFIRLNDLSGAGSRPGPGDRETGSGDSEAEALPYPALAPVVFFYLSQESRPRSWCLRLVCNPYPLQVFGGESILYLDWGAFSLVVWCGDGGTVLLFYFSSPLRLERGHEVCPDPEILQSLKSCGF
ncbi:hypothetical protein BTVI_110429 [Pitangus sulphuratus]|nr:hypothetical protein BTVI_110429 [Pitangus sulphuratus]